MLYMLGDGSVTTLCLKYATAGWWWEVGSAGKVLAVQAWRPEFGMVACTVNLMLEGQSQEAPRVQCHPA